MLCPRRASSAYPKRKARTDEESLAVTLEWRATEKPLGRDGANAYDAVEGSLDRESDATTRGPGARVAVTRLMPNDPAGSDEIVTRRVA
jgi:hypothetical protein